MKPMRPFHVDAYRTARQLTRAQDCGPPKKQPKVDTTATKLNLPKPHPFPNPIQCHTAAQICQSARLPDQLRSLHIHTHTHIYIYTNTHTHTNRGDPWCKPENEELRRSGAPVCGASFASTEAGVPRSPGQRAKLPQASKLLLLLWRQCLVLPAKLLDSGLAFRFRV